MGVEGADECTKVYMGVYNGIHECTWVYMILHECAYMGARAYIHERICMGVHECSYNGVAT